jgi:TolB protein
MNTATTNKAVIRVFMLATMAGVLAAPAAGSGTLKAVMPGAKQSAVARARDSGAGGRIVFASGGTTIHGDFLGDLYVVNADGKDLRRLLRTRDISEQDPATSPDGARIAFSRYGYVYPPSRWTGIWVVDADGTNAKRLSNAGDNPAWSPDGRAIAFSSWRSGKCALVVMSASGGPQRSLNKFGPTSGCFSHPTWSPDGRKIAFERGYQIYVMPTDGSSGPRRITRTGFETSPAWSPDGRHIAFIRGRDIYVMSASGTRRQRLTRTRALEYNPAWSPDAQKMAFVADTDPNGFANEDVWVMDADGRNARRLVHTRTDDSTPSWSRQ